MPESTTAPKDHVEALTEKIDLILLGYYGGLLPTAAHAALADVQSRLPSLLEGVRAAERERLALTSSTQTRNNTAPMKPRIVQRADE